MKKYIIEFQIKRTEEYTSFDRAKEAKKFYEKDGKDVRLFEVEETKKEL